MQDFYLVKAVKRADGKYETQIAEKVFSNYTDAYAKECKPQELRQAPGGRAGS